METLHTMVTAHLKEREFNFTYHNERSVFEFGVAGENGNWKVFVGIQEEKRIIQIISICLINTPLSQQLQMCELLNRINYNIILGKFSMDFNDGEVSYQTAGIYSDVELSEQCLYHLIQTNFRSFDEYLPAIIAVDYRHNEPLLAFLETQQNEPSLN